MVGLELWQLLLALLLPPLLVGGGLGWGLRRVLKRQAELLRNQTAECRALEEAVKGHFERLAESRSRDLAKLSAEVGELRGTPPAPQAAPPSPRDSEGSSNAESSPGASPAQPTIETEPEVMPEELVLDDAVETSPAPAANPPEVTEAEPEPKLEHEPEPSPEPVPKRAPAHRGDPQGRLEDLLHDDAFRKDFWPGLDGPFDACASRLEEYLVERGVGSVEITCSPRIDDAESPHWRFLVVQVRGAIKRGQDRVRFLIPGFYSRYDAAWLDYLFNAHGRESLGEKFVLGLSRCAQLEANGDLGGAIPESLVRRPGRISVGT